MFSGELNKLLMRRDQADLDDDQYGLGMSHIKDRSDRYRYFAENNMELVMDFD